jgi:hypothetical protein
MTVAKSSGALPWPLVSGAGGAILHSSNKPINTVRRSFLALRFTAGYGQGVGADRRMNGGSLCARPSAAAAQRPVIGVLLPSLLMYAYWR